MKSGVLRNDGLIYLFDDRPTDSYMKYGKIGFYRLGFTDMHEVKINFRNPCTGSIAVESSLDGKTVEATLSQVEAITDALSHTLNCSNSGRWHNITVRGNFDITHLEYRATVAGRR